MKKLMTTVSTIEIGEQKRRHPEGAAAFTASPHPRIDDPAHPWVPTLAAIRTVDALGGRGHAEA